jgi:RIO-like serine/threonine protein kinase
MSDILTKQKRIIKNRTLYSPVKEKVVKKNKKKSPKKDKIFIKKNVNPREVAVHKYVYDLNIVNTPTVLDYNPKTRIMKMENIPHLSVADFFGSDIDNVPEEIIEMIRYIVKSLYDVGVEFPDISGYNFIYDETLNKMWVIDYGNAVFLEDIKLAEEETFKRDEFVEEFMEGLNSWNPDFL